MHRSPTWTAVLMTIIVAGCSMAEVSSPSGRASPPGPSQPPSPSAAAAASASASLAERQPLPTGFPVLAGAVAVAMPRDDPGLIGLWESDQVGSAAYDFYVEALPTAGYPITGLYPGGDVAMIRFQAANGVWQLISHASAEGGTTIEVRLDRP